MGPKDHGPWCTAPLAPPVWPPLPNSRDLIPVDYAICMSALQERVYHDRKFETVDRSCDRVGVVQTMGGATIGLRDMTPHFQTQGDTFL